MISLITGLPGNGKTLFALATIKQKAEKEQREVYYHNIKDLNLPWTVFEPEKWMDLPHGSIIVIDECQFVFPKKPNGSKLPEFYEQLATHRHRGFDIYLITQHPTLLDNFVRQLVGQHYHSIRKFGLARSTIYEWSAANPSPQSLSSQKSAITLKWAYPKEVYGWYKSAEVHTVKRAIPVKLFLAAAFVVAIGAGVYYKLGHFHGSDKPKVEGVVQAPAGAASVGQGSPGRADKPFDALADAKNFVAMNTPRVIGLPQTAPKYDELTKPVRVPVPAACLQIGSAHSEGGKAVQCKCFTQQGTPMDVALGMCMEFARNGFFQDFDPDKDRASSDRTIRGQDVLAERPDVAIRDRSEPVVMAFNEVPAPPRVRGAPAVQGPNSDGLPNGGRGRAFPPVGSSSSGAQP